MPSIAQNKQRLRYANAHGGKGRKPGKIGSSADPERAKAETGTAKLGHETRQTPEGGKVEKAQR